MRRIPTRRQLPGDLLNSNRYCAAQPRRSDAHCYRGAGGRIGHFCYIYTGSHATVARLAIYIYNIYIDLHSLDFTQKTLDLDLALARPRALSRAKSE